MDLGVTGKLAVITGGSVGIGLAVARGFAAEGANVLIAARGEQRAKDEAGSIAAEFGVKAQGIGSDVATAAGCEAVISAARAITAW